MQKGSRREERICASERVQAAVDDICTTTLRVTTIDVGVLPGPGGLSVLRPFANRLLARLHHRIAAGEGGKVNLMRNGHSALQEARLSSKRRSGLNWEESGHAPTRLTALA